jgi:hypothetical protein
MPGAPYPCLPIPYNAPSVTDCLPPNAWSMPPEAGPRPHHWYFGTEYLHWWVSKRMVPPVVTRGQFSDATPGAAGQPGTELVLGGGSADTGSHNGIRGVFQVWFDDCHTCGIDGSAWVLEERTQYLIALSNGDGNTLPLTRPFFNPNTRRYDADPIALPNVMAGLLQVRLPRRMWGGDMNFRYSTDEGPFSHIKWSFLAGARYASLDEQFAVDEATADLPFDGDPGIHTIILDEFTTFNRYYGAQIGLESDLRLGPVYLTITSKVGAGQTRQTLIVKGGTAVWELGPDRRTVDPTKGFLAQSTNIGRYRRNTFSWMPEMTVRLGADLNPWVSVWMGYNFLWWTDVLRPGDQVDTTINPQPTGVDAPFTGRDARPAVFLKHTDVWAQGLSFGFLVSF